MERKKSRKIILIILVIVLFSITGLILANESNQEKISNFINLYKMKEKKLELISSINNEDIIDFHMINNNIVIWKKNSLSFAKKDGDIILEEEFNFSEPDILFGEKYIYPYDKNTGNIYFYKRNGQYFNNLQIGKKIFNIKELEGHLLCHSKQESMENLDVFNGNSVLIGNTSFKDKNILTYDINKKGDRILVSLLNFNNNILKSEIYSFGENNEELGSFSIQGEVVLFNKIIEKNKQVILTDKSLYLIEEDELLWEKSYTLIKDIYVSRNKIYLLHGNYLKLLNFQGQVESEIGFTEDYNNIMEFKASTLLYGDENLLIVREGEIITEFKEPILKVATNGKNILILNRDGLNVYKLVNKE